jgi:release factor glutamine methyltransferase
VALTRLQSVLAAARRLGHAGVAVPRVEAEALLAHVLSQPRRACYLEPATTLTPDEAARLLGLVARRADGVPLQYLTGTERFCGLDLEVTPDVLIPRPETEGVVAAANRILTQRYPAEWSPVVADIGTGSGCIALALAVARPNARVYAIDRSPAALVVAARNARRVGVTDRVTLLEGDLCEPLARAGIRIDLVVSNPPYVADGDLPTLQTEVRHEPPLALRGGRDGLDVYRRILAQVGGVLAEGGSLVVELGFGQSGLARRLAESAGFVVEGVELDTQGIPRVMSLRTPRQGMRVKGISLLGPGLQVLRGA